MSASTSNVSLETTTLRTENSSLNNAANQALQIIVAIVLALIMFGLGCSVTYKSMWYYVKRPLQFIVALFLQLVVMPFLGFGLARAFQMTSAQTIGVLIMATCPGGAYSNIVSYWMDGDMDLSIVMTTASTLFALGTMPLWLFVFPHMMSLDNRLKVPFDQLGYALLGIVIPVFVGSLVKYKFPKKSEIITKLCSVIGSIAILITIIVFAIVKQVNYAISWKQIVVVLLLPGLALLLGYLATRLPWLEFTVRARRTVAIETAMQSSAVGTAIVIRSFDFRLDEFDVIFLFPAMYGIVQLFFAFVIVVTYIILKRRGVKWVQPNEKTNLPVTSDDNGVTNLAFDEEDS